MMLMTPSVPATSISRRLRVPSKTLMLALFHAKQVIPKREKRKKKIVKKYVGVQSWKAAHLPTLEIRVEQKGNRVKKGEKRKKLMLPRPGIEPGTRR